MKFILRRNSSKTFRNMGSEKWNSIGVRAFNWQNEFLANIINYGKQKFISWKIKY